MDRESHLRIVFGEDVMTVVKQCKVLVVGAGGIGCELLKDLVLTGFEDIEVIDLDTIDVSNLNRQFLFRKEHVGRSKAEVARESVLLFNPAVCIVAHHGNIKSAEFDVEFFRKFRVVFNALDNLDARRHVNRLCLAADIPLIEAGTTGYLGQVTVIQKGQTECFECLPKATPKVYPVCTIRSTPDKPVHCITWAKFLFSLLFGPQDEANLLADLKHDVTVNDSNIDAYSRTVFDKVFGSDIQKQCDLENVWKDRVKPTPCFYTSIQLQQSNGQSNVSAVGLRDQQVYSLAENADLFIACIRTMFGERKNDIGVVIFDKDDETALNFVTAASNLRSYNYHIPMKSRFEVKEIAGNIVPAIATTNAIVSGIQVLEAIKVLRGRLSECKTVWCQRIPSRNKLLYATALEKPNPKCYVCSKNNLQLRVDLSRFTLNQFISQVLQNRLGMNQPLILRGDDILYEKGEGLDEEEVAQYESLALKRLCELDIQHGSMLAVEDFSQHFRCDISLSHQPDLKDEEAPEGFLLTGVSATVTQTDADDGSAGNDVRMATVCESVGAKRKLEETADADGSHKKNRVDVIAVEDGVVTLD
eukprot:GILJ01005361.1.p1 GENE.GILJ01005361.1~~GILJ01005361.1.p1  ORF type:complete len:587 (-),score=113.48 GILJ01005361.1:78-1838(-)